MSLLFFDGFGGGAERPEWNPKPVPNAGNPRTVGGWSASGSSLPVLTIPASSKVYVGFGYRGSVWNAASQFLMQFRGDAGATTHLTVGFDATRRLTLRLGGVAGTLLATATDPFPDATWRHVQISATIADSGGNVVVKVEGVEVINYTGDTKNAGTATTIDRLAMDGDTSGGGAGTNWSDLWVCDAVDATATQGRPNNTFLGDLKVAVMFPAGDGAVNSWVGSDGNSVSNYLLVDEISPNATDYVGSATPGARDLYALPDLDASATDVYALRTHSYVAKSDAGAASVKPILRQSDGTVTDDLAPFVLSTTWSDLHGPIRTVKPGTTTPWTKADVNGLQVGVEVV